MGGRPLVALNFGRLDLAEPIDQPPLVWHVIRVPCACGRSLDEPVYTFFPSSVFVHGVCPACGPQSAIFAPHMKGQGEKLPERIASTLQRLTQDLARIYGATPASVAAEVLEFFAAREQAASKEEENAEDREKTT